MACFLIIISIIYIFNLSFNILYALHKRAIRYIFTFFFYPKNSCMGKRCKIWHAQMLTSIVANVRASTANYTEPGTSLMYVILSWVIRYYAMQFSRIDIRVLFCLFFFLSALVYVIPGWYRNSAIRIYLHAVRARYIYGLEIGSPYRVYCYVAFCGKKKNEKVSLVCKRYIP